MKRLFLILTGIALIFATSCREKNKVTEPALKFKHKSSGVTAFVDDGKVFLQVNNEYYKSPDKNSMKPVEGLKGTCRGVYIGDEGNDINVLICMLLEDGSLQVLSLFDILNENSFTASDKIRGLSGIVAFFTSDGTEDTEDSDDVGYGAWCTFAVDKNGKEYMLADYLDESPSEAGKYDYLAGTYRMDRENCDCEDDMTLTLSAENGKYAYRLKTPKQDVSGMANIITDEDNNTVIVKLPEVKWASYKGPVPEGKDVDDMPEQDVFEVSFEFRDDHALVTQNYGNAMNFYVKFAEYECKYIYLSEK
ncbi:MAG: hypothetical protein LBC47_06545 [Tannerella sp.]|jgi:hypothetical protein|nr:hypothetical protein [Tannerella sp.]